MPAELVRVDALLDDERFFAPYREFFHATLGRPSIPIETYLRLMFLKYRYRLGFETLCREVTDSITWQRFCRIPLGGAGAASDDVDEDHHPLRAGRGRRVERGVVGPSGRGQGVEDEPGARRHHRGRGQRRLSVGLVAARQGCREDGQRGARSCGRWAWRRAPGWPTRRGTVRSRARSINANLRRRNDDKIAEVKRINGELAGIAERVARQADAVVRNARRKLRTLGDQASGRARAAVDDVERTAALTRQVAAQTRQRLAGETPAGATQGGVVARRRCPSDRQGPTRQAGRVRLQGAARRQRRRRHRRSQHRSGQPARRADAGAGDQTDQASAPGAPHGRSPPIVATANKVSRTTCATPACATSCSPPKADRPRRVARSRTDVPSRRWCDGAPVVKDGSAAPNATSDSPGRASTGSPAHEHGAATASSPTTSSRSAG